MKTTHEQARSARKSALLLTDGDRAAAADKLNISERTLFRYLGKYKMYDIIERCDWGQHKALRGNVEAMTKRTREVVLRASAAKYIRSVKGNVDYGDLTRAIYGKDDPEHRQKMQQLITYMMRHGQVAVNESTGRMTLLTDNG